MTDIRVLVVEDERLLAEAQRRTPSGCPGFAVAGVAHPAAGDGGAAAPARVRVDLSCSTSACRTGTAWDVLPGPCGRSGSSVDVLAVTSARDLARWSRTAVSLGVEPTTCSSRSPSPSFRDKLELYADYRPPGARRG